jgi:hypothetical protein
VLAEFAVRNKAGLNPERFLSKKSGQLFYNTSKLDLKTLMGDAVRSPEPPRLPPSLLCGLTA